MMFAIKTEISDPLRETFAFNAQKTMYGGKYIAQGDTIFVFASENEGGAGLIVSGVVTSPKRSQKNAGLPDKRRASASLLNALRWRSGASGGAS
jgi:hypothetical protein